MQDDVTPSGMWFGISVGIPMPRLTYWPSVAASVRPSSGAGHSAILPVAASIVIGAHRPLFSIRFSGLGTCTTRCTKMPGVCTVGGVDLSGLDELLDLGDRDPAGRGTVRVEVGGGLPVDEVAVPVALPGVHQREVGADGPLENVGDTVELAGLLGGETTATAPDAS